MDVNITKNIKTIRASKKKAAINGSRSTPPIQDSENNTGKKTPHVSALTRNSVLCLLQNDEPVLCNRGASAIDQRQSSIDSADALACPQVVSISRQKNGLSFAATMEINACAVANKSPCRSIMSYLFVRAALMPSLTFSLCAVHVIRPRGQIRLTIDRSAAIT